jgi:hypothetical protein
MKNHLPKLTKLHKSEAFKKSRFSKANLAVFAIIFASIGGYLIYSSFAAGTTANLWVDSNGGSCVRSATPVTYNDAQACSSFDLANDKCQNNDITLVKGSNYGDQSLSGSNSRTAACTIQAASGETVNIHSLDLKSGANWLTFKDITDPSGVSQHNGNGSGCTTAVCVNADNITLDNFDITGPYAYLGIQGNNFTWKNSEMGTAGNTNATPRLCGTGGDPEPVQISVSNNVLMDHIIFHPFFGEDIASHCGGNDVYHLETLRAWDTVDGLTLSNSHFDDGGGDDSFTFSSSRGGCSVAQCPTNKNLRFINNYWGAKCCGYAGEDIGFGDNENCVNYVFVYNFFKSGTTGLYNNCATQSGMVYVGNVAFNGNSGGCAVSGVNTRNLFLTSNGSPGSCAGNTWLTGSTPGNWAPLKLAVDGFHLTSTSPAINAGENTYCTQYAAGLDVDGGIRTGVCDAGPDEYGVTQGPPDTTPPTVSITTPSSGATISSTTTVSANAADDIGIAGVQFKVDDNNIGTEDSSSPYSVSWDPAALNNGSHTLTAVARDAAGNTTTSSGVTVTVNNPPDTTPPTVSITTPSSGATISGNITVSANASDNAAVAGVQFKLDGANLQAEDTASPYTISWDTTAASNGAHTLTAVAHDGAGNITTSPTINVTITNVAAGAFLLGDQTIEGQTDQTSVNQVEAWPYTAVASGTTATLAIYFGIATGTTQPIQVGLYSDSAGNPGSLLSQATIGNPTSGWNGITLSPQVNIINGTQYWIAVLGADTAHSVTLRDHTRPGSCTAVAGSSNNWTSLNSSFGTPGLGFADCPLSAYVTAGSTTPKTGDINGDNAVNITDLSLLLSSYGQNTTQCITNNAYKCDLSSPADGVINIFDLSILLSGYGK